VHRQFRMPWYFTGFILVIIGVQIGALVTGFILSAAGNNPPVSLAQLEKQAMEALTEAEPGGQSQPEKGVYRNTVYGFAFSYPPDAHVSFQENLHSEVGSDLGTKVPFQAIELVLDGKVAIEVWNSSVGCPGGSLRPVQGLKTAAQDESIQCVQAGSYAVRIHQIPLDNVPNSEVFKHVISSFRLTGSQTQQTPSNWPQFEAEGMASVRHPHDWEASASSDGYIEFIELLVSLPARIDSKPQHPRDQWSPDQMSPYLTRHYQVHDLNMVTQFVSDPDIAHIYGKKYEKRHSQQQLGRNTLHRSEICNAQEMTGGGSYRINPGERCIVYWYLMNPAETASLVLVSDTEYAESSEMIKSKRPLLKFQQEPIRSILESLELQ
jgi:hypothetical protein